MKKKKQFWAFIGLSLLVLLLFSILYRHYDNDDENSYITKAQAAKSMALAFLPKTELGLTEESYFGTKDKGMWYVKYMDYMFQEELYSLDLTTPSRKDAGRALTMAELAVILEKFSITPEDHGIFAGRYGKRAVPREMWWEYYDLILAAGETETGVYQEEIQVYGTPANIEGSSSWQLYTDNAVLGFEGLALDACIDQKIAVYVKDGEILGFKKVISETVRYENLWLMDYNDNELRVYLNGRERSFSLTGVSLTLSGSLGDIEVEKGTVLKLDLKNDRIRGKVLAISEDFIEVEGYGRVPLSTNFRVYKTYGLFGQRRWEDILVGYEVYDFITGKGEICGAVIREDIDGKIIRVLLTSTDFKSIYHDQVSLTSSGDFTLSDNEGQVHYSGGTVLNLSPDDELLAKGRLTITPAIDSEIVLLSINRSYGNPSYEGVIEIYQDDEGLLVVNELAMEKYLKRVVPSEMPASFGVEALKVQAVCARSYAYNQIQGNAYSHYGAHVDDTTKFQVYNNQQEQAASNQAIDETYGQVLCYDDQVITAYYFSTSCGATADAAVWGSNGDDYPYLAGGLLHQTQELDLADEQVFKEFIMDWEYGTYDKASTWYRWKTFLSLDNLKNKVSGVGDIQSVAVMTRGQGGIALKMVIKGTEGECYLENQNQIREVLGDVNQTIDKKDGTQSSDWSSLPSAFIYLAEKQADGELIGYDIYGGGYGHGVGMSQWAVPEMVRLGMKYDEILEFFYKGIAILEL